MVIGKVPVARFVNPDSLIEKYSVNSSTSPTRELARCYTQTGSKSPPIQQCFASVPERHRASLCSTQQSRDSSLYSDLMAEDTAEMQRAERKLNNDLSLAPELGIQEQRLQALRFSSCSQDLFDLSLRDGWICRCPSPPQVVRQLRTQQPQACCGSRCPGD